MQELQKQDDEGGDHAQKDYRHLILLGEADGFAAARNGIENDQDSTAENGGAQRPGQNA